MSTIRSIYGDDVAVETGQYPEVFKLTPTNAILVGEVLRDESMYINLEDKYYLSCSESKKTWLLWVSVKGKRSYRLIPLMNKLLAWCNVSEIEPKSATAALLEFTWTNQGSRTCGVIYETSKIRASGLLSMAALKEIKDVSLGIYLKDEIPFEESKQVSGIGLTLKERGIRLREAGPNNPIYKRGWIIGGTRLNH
jgi:hypothetical protein